MQNLGTAAGDFLRLVVFESAQQPCRRHGAWVRAEHTGYVGPDLQPTRLQFRREVAAGSIGAAATEQYGIAALVAADEPLRDPHRPGRRPPLLQVRIRIVSAGRGEITRTHGGVASRLRLDDGARIDPLHVETLRGQKCGAEPRRHQLALRHDAGTQTLAHLADQRDAGGDLSQTFELLFELRAGNHTEVAREIAMALLDLLHDRLPLVAKREAEQLFESIGDARQGGMDDDGPHAFREAITQHRGDVLPVRDRGNAGAAELQHDPRRGAGRRISHRH